MIELKNNQLVFTFPEVHRDATARIEFQRTLRIPDDGETYHLPPGLGAFPLRHAEDFTGKIPASWIKRGGVMLPMYQSEALWLNFNGAYPCAIKVATGKINAVNGTEWQPGLCRDPQNYVVIPDQPWLDGYCVEKGTIRQFVAMPLGSGYTVEEQITGEAEFGGIQIEVFPLKAATWEAYSKPRSNLIHNPNLVYSCHFEECAMGLAPGGRMRQMIYDDPFKPEDWDTEHPSRCFIHLCNSLVWQSITGSPPPYPPVTAEAYSKAGLPWFDYYSETPGIEGSKKLNALKSVKEMGEQKKENPLPENASTKAVVVHTLKKNKHAVIQWDDNKAL